MAFMFFAVSSMNGPLNATLHSGSMRAAIGSTERIILTMVSGEPTKEALSLSSFF